MLNFASFSELSVTDSCFVNNVGSGNVGAVILQQNPNRGIFSGNYGSMNVLGAFPVELNASCSDDIATYLIGMDSCEEFDAETCRLLPPPMDETGVPTAAPNSSHAASSRDTTTIILALWTAACTASITFILEMF
jgi:hypothetical protein